MARLHHHLKNAFIPHPGNAYQPHALRRPMLSLYAIGIIAIKVIVVGLVAFYAQLARVSDITPGNIVALSNQAREQQHLSTLTTNPLLTKAAESKATDMTKGQYFAHISPKGVTPWVWFKQAGYSYSYAGENLALDFVTGEDVIAAWLNSPSHRRNLLSTKYKDIGVAVATAKIDGLDSMIVVQMFGSPVPQPATKKVTAPAQTPLPSVAKKQLAATPAPTPEPVVPTKVLGEASQSTPPPPTPPAVPTISTPNGDSLVRTTQPEIVGRAEPGSVVALYVNSQSVATATTDDAGIFSIAPPGMLADGQVTLQVGATARGLSSALSPSRTVTVDTSSPTIEPHQAILLPSYLVDDGYDVSVAVSGQPTSVVLHGGGQSVPLLQHGQTYNGIIPLHSTGTPGLVTVLATDNAGNSVHEVLADPDMFTTGVVASTTGPWIITLKLIFFSRAFLVAFLTLMCLAVIINLAVEWRHQHHPTVVASFLVIFLATTFLLM